MTQRLAPWQRINIALARGILLQPSGNMKWTASVTVFGVTPQQAQTFNLIDFAADSEADAARFAAEASAKRIYGDEGSSGFINNIKTFINNTEAPLYIASIGYYDGRGVTRGRSISILIRRYTHPVTGK